MPKSSSNMKKIKGPFEKYNLFEKMDLNDNCWEVDGVKVGGPGTFCWMYIFFVIIVNVVSLLNMNQFKEMGLSDAQIFVRFFFQFLFMFLSVTFLYSMCKRCRGLEGLLILMLLSFISALIALGPFLSKIQKDVKTLKKNVVEGSCGSKKKEGFENSKNSSTTCGK